MGLTDDRIYYNDSQCRAFSGVVMEQIQDKNHWQVRLNTTAFYPTSGGQPHDTGTLNGIKVTDVLVRDNQVFHVVGQSFSVGESVVGTVDWERRFDHMQQHCGQHILSRCVELLYDVDTIGFHLGAEWVTLDLQVDALSWDEVQAVERKANQVIWDDRMIRARFVSDATLADLVLRHPPKVTKDVRIVSIEGFDDNPCGGTHPRSTGVVGQIRVVRMEKMHGGVRVTFVCGGRALRDGQKILQTLRDLGRALSTGQDELVDAVDKLQTSLQVIRKREIELMSKVAGMWAKQSVESATLNPHGVRVICASVDEVSAKDLKSFVTALISQFGSAPFKAACTCVEGNRVHVQMAASVSAGFDVNEALRKVLGNFDGRGGGTGTAAQGSAPLAAEVTEEVVLLSLRDELLA